MEKDPAGATNLIDRFPDVAGSLTEQLEEIHTSGRSVRR